MPSQNEIPILILAGGKGSRLSTLDPSIPKVMAPIDGHPFLDYLLGFLQNYKFKNIYLLTGYKENIIRDYYLKKDLSQIKIEFVNENTPLDTAGAINQAISILPHPFFLCLNGDSFFKIDFTSFVTSALNFLSSPNCLAAIALKNYSDSSRYGSVELDNQGNVINFYEKKDLSTGIINGGIYLLSRQILNIIPPNKPSSLEKEIFPLLAKEKKLRGMIFDNEFIDIGTPESYHKALSLLPTWQKVNIY